VATRPILLHFQYSCLFGLLLLHPLLLPDMA
jgi:hypothetical protein